MAALLAIQATRTSEADVLVYARPKEPGGEQTTRTTDTRVRKVVKSVKSWSAELEG